MDKISITTSQNVNIVFNLASVGERIFAFILDILIKIAYIIVINIVFPDLMKFLNSNLDRWFRVLILFFLLSPILFYTLVLESVMEGQTFGKRIMNIKVIKIDGYQASFGDYLIRWVFIPIDIYMSSGIVGLLLIIFSKNNQRIGNIISGTAVISLKNKINITHTILEEISQEYQPIFPQVVAFTDNDMRIIKENFIKADALNDKQVLERLVQKIEDILAIKFDTSQFTTREFIRTIIKDYNFYTGKEN